MAILNYSTGIDVDKTIMEIEKILTSYGAESIMKKITDRRIKAIGFSLRINGVICGYQLPANAEGTLEVFKRTRGIPKSAHTIEQAERTAWRNCKIWILAQLALVESGGAEMGEVFSPYLILKNGETMWRHIKQHHQQLLLT